MRMKLIATAVASLFAAGSALAADDNFQWAGSVTVGGRATDSDGVERNGAYGTSATTLAPFTGPKDGAKAQEYQNIDSAAIGVIDVRGGNRAYYFSLFGEELGRDDQFILMRGGGYDVFKAALYSDRMPHNLSWNALTPLMSAGTGYQFAPAGAYPPATNPATWNTFDYGLQRNVFGGNIEVNMKSPFYVRVDYNEVATTGVRPSSGQLGTGSGNGLIEFGLPTDYKTQNTNIEAGYKGKSWNVKLAFLDSKFDDKNQTAQWANFFMRSAMDTSLQPPDNDLKKWTLSGSWRDLPWDSTVLARYTQSKLTNSFDVMGGGLKGTSNAAPPTSVGYLVTAPSSSTFDGDIKTTTFSIAAQLGAARRARYASVLRVLRQGQRLDADLLRGRRAAGEQHLRLEQRNAVLHGRVHGSREFRVHQERGRPRSELPDRAQAEGVRRPVVAERRARARPGAAVRLHAGVARVPPHQ